MTKTYGWPPEQIQEMIRQLEAGDTFAQVGIKYEKSGELVRQLTGFKRGRTRSQQKMQKVVELFNSGKTDKQIAAELNLAQRSVRRYKMKAGLRHPNEHKRHSIESSIRYARLWFDEYGFTPGVADWSKVHALKLGHQERVERLEQFESLHGKPPTHKTIRQLFGSWPEFIRQSGLDPVPLGGRALGRFKVEEG